MKLYKTTAVNLSTDPAVAHTRKAQWTGSQAEASKSRAAMKKDGLKEITTADVDVPTDKAGLLAWLNTNAV